MMFLNLGSNLIWKEALNMDNNLLFKSPDGRYFHSVQQSIEYMLEIDAPKEDVEIMKTNLKYEQGVEPMAGTLGDFLVSDVGTEDEKEKGSANSQKMRRIVEKDKEKIKILERKFEERPVWTKAGIF